MIARPLVAFALTLGIVGAAFAQAKASSKEEAEVEATLSAIVRVKARSVPGARSSATLGDRREGSGVLVREGYVATIGYLVIEAEAIEVTNAEGKSVPATLAGYDHASGFGVLKLLAPLGGKPLPMGNAGALAERQPAMIAAHNGTDDPLNLVHVVSRRPFSGGWEYQLDSAIYTYPPVMNWSGASLIGTRGELLGLGSLIVGDAPGGGVGAPGNMFVPVDLLKPILDDLIARGKASGPVRPWLGMNTEEMRGRLLVTRVSPDGPAERAGVKSGDVVVGVGNEDVATLAELYRKIWARGAAGVDVPLRLLQGAATQTVTVRSIDRVEYFKARTTY